MDNAEQVIRPTILKAISHKYLFLKQETKIKGKKEGSSFRDLSLLRQRKTKIRNSIKL